MAKTRKSSPARLPTTIPTILPTLSVIDEASTVVAVLVGPGDEDEDENKQAVSDPLLMKKAAEEALNEATEPFIIYQPCD
jgi:hypothetical protein